MATAAVRPPAPSRSRGDGLARLIAAVLVLACIYLGQAVLIPVALAILVAFLLTPLVSALQRRRVPRVVAVLLVVAAALGVVGAVGTVLAVQVMGLAEELPRYQGNIREKIADLRLLGHGTGLQRAQEAVKRAATEAERQVERSLPDVKPAKPAPVVIEQDRSAKILSLPSVLSPWLDPLARAGFVVILVPFMLLAREELRNRVVRLLGLGQLALTTRALDEAGERVSRYLLTQSLVNTSFAALVAGGLFVIGVPYALLFGLLAGALRFLPYVGIWIGAGLPVAVAMAVFPGWTKALLVVALFAVLEAFTSGALEILLYARSAGVSEVGLLVAVAFWTWAWGPIGLLLATPVTVCLVVVAKYVPELEFLWVLMGDEPVVSTDVAVYQRLLAEDEDEASRIVHGYVAEHPGDGVYDEVLLAPLVLAARDHAQGRIDADARRFVVRAVRDLVEDLAPDREPAGTPPRGQVLASPVRSDGDEVALLMLRNMLSPSAIALDIVSPELLSAEVVRYARERGVDIALVGTLPPGGLAQARYLVKRLRAGVPGVKIVVGRWPADGDAEGAREALVMAGADVVATSLAETRDRVLGLAPVVSSAPDRAA
jgi:predicted PurR-regulated permease PerM